MTQQIRQVWKDDSEPSDSKYSFDGAQLGEPGDEGQVIIAKQQLEDIFGDANFEVLKDGRYVATVNGKNYLVSPCQVLHKGGGFCDEFIWVGTPTDHVPDPN